ncbi:PhzF family phenazine biosynthesis protein [Frigoriglobus tundricola]|uniref:Phenazine biosynthesis protein PhzF like n=1 Tax=Frigoriglobus tundricola TaxID=2774151 RepID=A0A6M5Z1R1_9BACT|nr:PhzF family phenazine biosynthesis protein [Frigoriglobus tundricola]QJX00310.1 Phenazine biosynthesis protein PhzF like [Frigoriglobus tundricola]
MVPLSVVDAFTDTPFAGNPAAVCLLDHWPVDTWLQLIGREMNLSETAFLVPHGTIGSGWELRWFTPKVEVALCGHATLASAHFLWSSGTTTQEPLTFQTRKSGTLTARRLASGEIELDFPARGAAPCAAPPELLEALGAHALAVGRNSDDYLVEVATDAEVRTLAPDLARLARTESRGVIVTARSADARYDFVSRFFAPAAGINEDPVTGSAHCCLSEWWGERLGKTEMTGFQASERGGVVRVVRSNGRVKLIGRAVTITTGHLAAGFECHGAE